MSARLAILYEHPEWFRPLFAELLRRGVEFEEWRADKLVFSLEETAFPDLVLNRMSPSALFRGHGNAQFAVRDYLAFLESRRVAVINGSEAYGYEISKVRQTELFRRCGVRTPRTTVVNDRSLLAAAVEGRVFPLLWKPNCGGAGALIRRFDSAAELLGAAATLEFGCDHTALLQDFIPTRDGCCYRIEVLDGEMLYAVKIQREGAGYNLCPADVCSSAARPVFTRVEPPPEAVISALALARAGRMEVCGVEYMFDHRTGEPVFYDVNALSNFVADAERVVGFNPTARFVDYLVRRLAAVGRLRY